MELTVLTQTQVDDTGLNVEGPFKMYTNVLEPSHASLICNVLVQQCLTEVIGTILVLIWVLRVGVAVPASGLRNDVCLLPKELDEEGTFHTFSTLCLRSSMRYFLAVGDVLTVLALGASNASKRILLIQCGTRCLYSGTSSVHKCQGQSLFKKCALPFLSTVNVTQIPVHRRDRGCASEEFNDRFRGGSSSAQPAQPALDSG